MKAEEPHPMISHETALAAAELAAGVIRLTRDYDRLVAGISAYLAAMSAAPTVAENATVAALPADDLVERLRLCADDPMWSDHAEVSKTLLARAATALTASRAEVERLTRERNNWTKISCEQADDYNNLLGAAQSAHDDLCTEFGTTDAMINGVCERLAAAIRAREGGMKLTSKEEIEAQREAFRIDLARTIITVAERHPALRGPWVFDEDDLQEAAKRARAALAKVKP